MINEKHRSDVSPSDDISPSASPVCYAGEGEDAYMGFAARDELLAFLNELLEAERAGARIAAGTVKESSDPDMVSLMKHVHDDEARWCAMLLKWIRNLDGEPSSKVGNFYEKCLAYSDLAQRAAFINRGQGWVVRKLRTMLPKIRVDGLHADLSEMLKCHEDNVVRTAALLGPEPCQGGPR